MSRSKTDKQPQPQSQPQSQSGSLAIPSVLSHHTTIGTQPPPISIQDSSRRAVAESVSAFPIPSSSSRPRALARNHSIYRENQARLQDDSYFSSNQNVNDASNDLLLHRDWERERKLKELIQVEWRNRGYDELELKQEVDTRIRLEDGVEEDPLVNQDSASLTDQTTTVSKRKGPLSVENSLILLQSLRQSRLLHLTAILPVFSIKLKSTPGNQTVLKYPSNLPSHLLHSFQPSAPHILTQLGRVNLKVGPHSFSKTKFWEVRPDHNSLPIGPQPGSQEEETMAKMNEIHSKKLREWKEDCDKRKLNWRKKNPDPRQVEKKKKSKFLTLMKKGKLPTNQDQNNSSSGSNTMRSNSSSGLSPSPNLPSNSNSTTVNQPASAPPNLDPNGIDPALIARVNARAATDSHLASLLAIAASGGANADQMRSLGSWIERLTKEMKDEQAIIQNAASFATSGNQQGSVNVNNNQNQDAIPGYVEKDKDLLEREGRAWEIAKAEFESRLPLPPTLEETLNSTQSTASSNPSIPTPISVLKSGLPSNPSNSDGNPSDDPLSFASLMSTFSKPAHHSASPMNASSHVYQSNQNQNSGIDLSQASTISPSDLMMVNPNSYSSVNSNPTYPFPSNPDSFASSSNSLFSNPMGNQTSNPTNPAINYNKTASSPAPSNSTLQNLPKPRQAVAWPQDFQPSPPLTILEFRESATIRFWFPLWNCSVERRALLKVGNNPLDPNDEIPKARELRKREIRVTMMLPSLGSEAAGFSPSSSSLDSSKSLETSFSISSNGKEKEKATTTAAATSTTPSSSDGEKKAERYPATYLLRGEDFEQDSGVSESIWETFSRCKIVRTVIGNPEMNETNRDQTSLASVQELGEGGGTGSKSPKKSSSVSRPVNLGESAMNGVEEEIEAAIESGGNAKWRVWNTPTPVSINAENEKGKESKEESEMESREKELKLGQKFAEMLQSLPTRRHPKYVLPGPNSIPKGLEEHLSDKYAPRSRTLTGKPVPNSKNKVASINVGHYNDLKGRSTSSVPEPNPAPIGSASMKDSTPSLTAGNEGEKTRRKPGPKPGTKPKKKGSKPGPKPKVQAGSSSFREAPNTSENKSKSHHQLGKFKGQGKGWRKGKSNEGTEISHSNSISSQSPAPAPVATATATATLTSAATAFASPSSLKKKIKLNLGSASGNRSASGNGSASGKGKSKATNRDFGSQIPPNPSSSSSPSKNLKRKSSSTDASSRKKPNQSSVGGTSTGAVAGTGAGAGTGTSAGTKLNSPTIIPHPTYHTKPTARQLAARNRLSSNAGEGAEAGGEGPGQDQSLNPGEGGGGGDGGANEGEGEKDGNGSGAVAGAGQGGSEQT